MSKVMLVNVTHVEESRVAVLEDGVLSAYEIETTNTTSLKGNIHNAVVESVHPSLEAAFVKIAPDLKGFLPLDEVNFNLLPSRTSDRKLGKIGQHLHVGQKILAQVVREPFAGKPPSVSTYFSLPGRYLVLMPGTESAGISRRIDNAEQREKLRKTIQEIQPPEGFGLIIRTAGMGQTKAELQRDLRYLLRLWESIQRASKLTEFPGRVYREADIVIRTMRDHFMPDIGEVWIDNPETHARALEFVKDVMPGRTKVVRLYTGERPLFNKFNLEEQIERIYKRRVPLPSGGEIVIDGTEALTAVDVNSARSKKQGDIEETLLQTNLEAAAEIARQLRLRDLGGLVVVDFIDMAPTRNKKKVEKAMRDAMRGDKARCELTSISKLGMMELARQRLRGTKMAASYATCPTCDGHGLIKNIETAALSVLRKLQGRNVRGESGRIRVSLPPEVATWLLNHKREELVRIEQRRNVEIEIDPRDALRRHESEFQLLPREREPQPAGASRAESPARAEATAGTRPPAPAPAAPGAAAERADTVVPFPPRSAVRPAEPETAAPADEAGGAARRETQGETKGESKGEGEADGEAPATRTRRRRRRKRRSRGGATNATATAAAGGSSAGNSAAGGSAAGGAEGGSDGRDSDSAVVPSGVRADELMPAAVGGRRSDKGAAAGGSGRRRRRGSGKGTRRSSGGREE